MIVPMTRAHLHACRDIVSHSEPWRTLKESINFLPALLRKQAYVCLSDGRVAGFVVFTPEPVFARGGYLRAIGVQPDMRRHGIGRNLLTFAERTTAQHAPNLFLCVSSFNRSAESFYRSCGYSRVGKIKDLIRKGASEYIYWKNLRPHP
jgi:ribosomal protein S18 acetylase RimI-like enzyme